MRGKFTRSRAYWRRALDPALNLASDKIDMTNFLLSLSIIVQNRGFSMNAQAIVFTFWITNSFPCTIPKLGNERLLINIKEVFLTNMLMMKKHRVKLKQILIIKTGFSVNLPHFKENEEHIFLLWIEVKGTFSNVLEGVNKKVHYFEQFVFIWEKN